MKAKSILLAVLCLFLNQVLIAQDSTEVTNLKLVKTLEGAYLNSGMGTDRLGGNKIGYLAEDIILQVTDSTKSLYKTQLSENRYAYIPKEYTADTIATDYVPVITSGSISVVGGNGCDRISVSLDQRRCYTVREEIEPNKMIIEFFGVQNNSNWVTQYLNLGAVSSIDVTQVDSDILRLTIGLKNKSSWGYSVKYENNRFVVEIKHLPKFSLKEMVIGIDAGHGGPDSPGARGRETRVNEKDLNLDMAHRLKRLFEAKGATVVLSRDKDTSLSMTERKAIFLENNIDMLISIHCNAGGTASGTSTYYKHIQNKKLAETVLESLLTIDGVNLFGLVGNFNFSLNAPTEYPAILVETLFLSHPQDEAKLNDPAFRELMMKKVAKGVKRYLKLCKKLEK